jgi:antitoxin component YwqK of YwqJK toxin-antitoxin module
MKKIILFLFFLHQLSFGQTTTLYDTISDKAYLAYSDSFKIVKHILRSEGIMKDGFQTGLWKSWYDNGQLADSGVYAIVTKNEITIYDSDSTFGYIDTNYIKKTFAEKYSFPSGHWVTYNRNGKIQDVGNYIPRGFVSTAAEEDPNGSIIFSWTPPTGMQTGIWKHYDENGKLESQENYKNGVNVGEIPIGEKVD